LGTLDDGLMGPDLIPATCPSARFSASVVT
jgi:hypothetical protein